MFHFIALNELNFDLLEKYARSQKLVYIAKILEKGQRFITTSENNYRYLEPWIQWYSMYSGKNAAEHAVFRLGDCKSGDKSVFSDFIDQGLTVGSFGMMNLPNDSKGYHFFIPDPWINESSDGGWWSRNLHRALRQAVGDNAAGRITLGTAVILIAAFFRFIPLKDYTFLLGFAVSSVKRSWLKVCFLDLFLAHCYLGLCRLNKDLDIGALFLNGGAHLQHHYFFNNTVASDSGKINPSWYCPINCDPIQDYMIVLDRICSLILTDNPHFCIATGLSQQPYDRIKFYYRLRDPKAFFWEIYGAGIGLLQACRLMTRDVRLTFDCPGKANEFAARLPNLLADGTPLFGDIQVKDAEVFCSFSYPNEIHPDFEILTDNGLKRKIYPDVVFCALKNGMHSQKGFGVMISPIENSFLKNKNFKLPIWELGNVLKEEVLGK